MSAHEKSIGDSDEWYTPKEIFSALGLSFDLDVASPKFNNWVPANSFLTKKEDGLKTEWLGTVWMNPPFGGRNGQVPWLEKFIDHGDGVALVAARTSAGWFHDLVPRCDAMMFPRGKTKFFRPDGSVGSSPGTGIVLLAMGSKSFEALNNSNLGIFVDLRNKGIAQ